MGVEGRHLCFGHVEVRFPETWLGKSIEQIVGHIITEPSESRDEEVSSYPGKRIEDVKDN